MPRICGINKLNRAGVIDRNLFTFEQGNTFTTQIVYLKFLDRRSTNSEALFLFLDMRQQKCQ